MSLSVILLTASSCSSWVAADRFTGSFCSVYFFSLCSCEDDLLKTHRKEYIVLQISWFFPLKLEEPVAVTLLLKLLTPWWCVGHGEFACIQTQAFTCSMAQLAAGCVRHVTADSGGAGMEERTLGPPASDLPLEPVLNGPGFLGWAKGWGEHAGASRGDSFRPSEWGRECKCEWVTSQCSCVPLQLWHSAAFVSG